MKRHVLSVGVAAVALSAAPADASQLVFDCGENLCRARPDGSGPRPIFTDGTSDRRYSGAGLSRGGRLAWVFGGAVHTRDIEGGPVISSTIPFVPVCAPEDGMRHAGSSAASCGDRRPPTSSPRRRRRTGGWWRSSGRR